ncbi:MAG: hypothetical protein JNJ94_12465 [Chlorobi bacterium]|nr:hypothetical protein [Chlorobiota bacterium]
MEEQPLRDTLVAVVTNDLDLRRFAEDGWYRIPARAVGRTIAADTLPQLTTIALYQTGAITAGLASAIELWGQITEITPQLRRQILPNEPDHPAADELYHVVRVAKTQRLERPIVCRRPRRVTFIRTNRDRLLNAVEINDLVIGSDAEERLWKSLENLQAERKYFMRVSDVMMEVDFALFQQNTTVGIIVAPDAPAPTPPASAPASALTPTDDTWRILRFSPNRLQSDFAGCLQEILSLVGTMKKTGAE